MGARISMSPVHGIPWYCMIHGTIVGDSGQHILFQAVGQRHCQRRDVPCLVAGNESTASSLAAGDTIGAAARSGYGAKGKAFGKLRIVS